MNLGRVAIVGGGRVGLSLARALAHSGVQVAVLSRTARPLPEPLGESVIEWDPELARADVLLLAVPDDLVASTASALAGSGTIGAGHVVLHLSGLLPASALAPLQPSGAALGSLHPLQTMADPLGSPELLRDAPAVVEGAVRAVAVAREIAAVCGMHPVVEVDPAGKARYHAAAVFASNYLAVLAGIADRLAAQAGIREGGALFLPLMHQTVVNLRSGPAAEVLTGPVKRGDVGTVMAHLTALDGDVRELYRMLGLAALEMAEPGLEPGRAAELRELMGEGEGPAAGPTAGPPPSPRGER